MPNRHGEFVWYELLTSNSDEASLAFASDKPRIGHCAWNEFVAVGPEAAKAFYFDEFGWSKDGVMDMGRWGVTNLSAITG